MASRPKAADPDAMLADARDGLKDAPPTPAGARRVAKRLREAHKPTFDEALAFMDGAAASGAARELHVGILVLAPRRHKLTSAHWPRVERWAESVEDAESADLLAKELVAPLLTREPQLAAKLGAWGRSAEPLRRRLAGASASGLDDAERLARLLDPLANEEDPVAQTGVLLGFFALAALDAERLLALLRAHPRMPLPLRREAAALLPAELALALATEALPTRAKGAPHRPAPKAKPKKAAAARRHEALERAQEQLARAKERLTRATRAAEEAREELEAAKRERAVAQERVDDARRKN
ncbi:MAG TPA: DNA alkylation repair protein [Candidatus Thermoplasmatota archaeon]|nr:DNA alkylation repair protein [Candidatus Thermoplasmatota archaeon]